MSSGLPTSDEGEPQVLLDTSAALALVNPADPRGAAVAARIGSRRCGLSGHAEFELYSVLTRLPAPSRVTPAQAAASMAELFPYTRHPAPGRLREAIGDFRRAGVAGGAVYDGLVALAARTAGCPLMSCDRRATRTYAALGVTFEIVE